MRIARWREADGAEWVGVEREGALYPVQRALDPRDGDHAALRLATGGLTVERGADAVDAETVVLLAPIRRPGAIRDFYAFEQHVRAGKASRGLEMDPDWYALPVFYFSNPHTIYGPGEDIPMPETGELDFELEVAAVIGRDASNLAPSEALDAIAGYTVFNDFSARDLQRREMRQSLGPAKGKDFASVLGPVLVTPDELGGDRARPEAAMRAWVNGQLYSQGNLADLHHTFADMIAYASRDSLLRAGDLVGSGTVGTGCLLELRLTRADDPPAWLGAGDVVELEVEGIGILRNRVAVRKTARDVR